MGLTKIPYAHEGAMSELAKKRYSIFLPKTNFPMKAELPQREPKRIERWKAEQVYYRVEAKRRFDNANGNGRGRKILHDGPPYANGPIHMGHALNKILKDIVVKSLWLDGYESPYIPGWDCHGLPIEHAVEKSLGGKRREMSQFDFMTKCRQYAQKWVDSQCLDFQRLGIMGDWNEPYITMEPKYEASVVRLLGRLFQCGIIKRKLKVVHWSYGARTALAEAEVEYADRSSLAITVVFPVKDEEARRMQLPTPLFLPIWTTTPWTLPANRAIAVHPDMDYAIVSAGGRHYVVAVALLEIFQKNIGINLQVDKVCKGKDLQGLKASHCWLDRESPVLLASYVTADTGTGLVHTAPDHGVDDFNLAHHLGLLQLVGPDGRYTANIDDPELEGRNIFDSNTLIVDRLNSLGVLLHEEKLLHSYPHCWRTKTPILFRATEQWFITMDDCVSENGGTLRDLGLVGVDNTEWVPTHGHNRIHAMIADRPDWCISRQRSWGTPIAVLRCTDCGEPMVRAEIFEKAAVAIERGGVEAWTALSVESVLPKDAVCSVCSSKEFRKETDILDVWIDSGASASVVCSTHSQLTLDDYGKFIYLEGSDQHRGWFHSSLLFNLAATGKKPYHTVVTHGFVLDGKNQKMSKSIGNVITPDEVIKIFGADILRWWAASVNYNDDVHISKEILERSADAYRKIRNTIRFLLGALAEFNPTNDLVPESQWSPLDLWVYESFKRLVDQVSNHYRNYQFLNVTQLIHAFCQLELSGRYFEIIKDRLYCDSLNSMRRRSCRTVCWQLVQGLTKLLAPILSFTADEIWDNIPGVEGCVFEQCYPEGNGGPVSNNWERFWEIREIVHKEMEPYRATKAIGTSLDAEVQLAMNDVDCAIVNDLGESVEDLLVISGLTINNGHDLQVAINIHSGIKCPRCWNHKGGYGQGDDVALCLRCLDVISKT
jgi:isoleucyl-tRNA synthetase